MEFEDHLTCSWSAVELINRNAVTRATYMNSKSRWNGTLLTQIKR
ncbi:hypothetical protein HanRHA438_Chr14g0663221 [Helianthus annuus]|nr:hypothetical protein HanHA300_Chr14g0531001 [Helianthus annuus]KAJ0486366.1 hypothetical protein HanHA89_Chr14g0578881 [Helianthus annuus]KAJ0656919.1 hypothetical protein HanLR1_Chr14g0541311 [Helianthus annuus]KAJ0854494.1 hypothetical protein HanRHA438_Chr14g0663221 [Helianthus annuus]